MQIFFYLISSKRQSGKGSKFSFLVEKKSFQSVQSIAKKLSFFN